MRLAAAPRDLRPLTRAFTARSAARFMESQLVDYDPVAAANLALAASGGTPERVERERTILVELGEAPWDDIEGVVDEHTFAHLPDGALDHRYTYDPDDNDAPMLDELLAEIVAMFDVLAAHMEPAPALPLRLLDDDCNIRSAGPDLAQDAADASPPTSIELVDALLGPNGPNGTGVTPAAALTL